MMPQSPTHPSSKRTFLAASPSGAAAKKRHKRYRQEAPYANGLADSLSLSSSAPASLRFPSSSSAFFPHGLSSIARAPPPATPPTITHTSLDDLHREAFTSLRQSVTASGEGFVRRMREWEQRRHVESSKSAFLGNCESGSSKRREPHTATRELRRSAGSSALYGGEHPPCRQSKIPTNCDSKQFVSPFTEDDDIMLIDDEADFLYPQPIPEKKHPRLIPAKRHPIDDSYTGSISFDGVEEAIYSQYTCTVDPTISYIAAQTSPFSTDNTSDDDSSFDNSYSPHHLAISSPYYPLKTKYLFTADQPLHELAISAQYPHRTDVSDSCSTDKAAQFHFLPMADMPSPRPEHCAFNVCEESTRDRMSEWTQSASDKALAAIVIALSNGSGGLKDYRDIQEVQAELEELQAGALWD